MTRGGKERALGRSVRRVGGPGLRQAPALLVLLALGGCAIGPEFARPPAPPVDRYTHGTLPNQTVSALGQGQRFVTGGQIEADWWRLFHSAELDAVIKAALANNQQLKSAQARLRQSQEQLAATRGVLFPQVDGSLGVTRQKFSPARFGGTGTSSTFTLYSAGATVSYTLDLFGGSRRALESGEALVDYQRYEAQATYLTLIGNVINATISAAAYREQIRATQDILQSEQHQLKLVEAQAQAGIAPYSAVLSLLSTVAATQAQLPALQQRLAQVEHLLATLTGTTPAQAGQATVALSDLTLPGQLPVSLPSDLVRQRPDVLAAEAQLHAASANIGVAEAEMLPHISLSGDLSQNSLSASNLFSSGSGVWSLGANLLAPIFHGGTLLANKRAAVAAYDASLADYHQTVLSAFAQVADVLRALEHDAQALEAQSRAYDSARRGLTLTEASYKAGIVDYLAVLSADQQYQQARIAYVNAVAQRYQDTAALFAALGGGWWNAPARTAGTAETPAPASAEPAKTPADADKTTARPSSPPG